MAQRLFLCLAFALLLSTGAAYAETYGAVLTAAQEVPPTNSTGFGNATVTLDPSHTSITVVMTVSGLTSPINNAHIHGEAPRGTSIGTKVNFNPATNIVNGQMNTTFTIDKALGDAIAAHPELYYINVHTTQNGGGEIRGQLTPLDSIVTFAADLRGENETPAPIVTSAVGAAVVTIDPGNLLTWEVNATGLTSPTLGHIHEGAAGIGGSPVVTFATNSSFFTGNRLKGSQQLDATLANRIRTNPAGFYVNVHTSANGGGEIRGQLTAAVENDVAVAGKVSGSGGENFVTDVRIFNPSYTKRASALVEYFQAGSSANVNAANSMAIDIAPRGTAVLNDIAGTSGLNLAGTTGGVRVTSIVPLAVTSRIFDDRRARNAGTIGQFVPSMSRANQLRRGVLPQLASDAGTRTNIGFFNPANTSVDVRLEARAADGTLLGTRALTLAAQSQQQNTLGSYFSGVDLSNRSTLTLSFDASAPIIVYGSAIDNVSSDQIFVSPAPDAGVATQ